MLKSSACLLCFSLVLLPVAVADETFGVGAASGVSGAVQALSLPKCRQAVAGYLMETPQESHQGTIQRIWEANSSSVDNRTPAEASRIAGGISADFSQSEITWALNGFSNENAQDRTNLANLIIDAYLQGALAENLQVQTLKDNFQILPVPPSGAIAPAPPQTVFSEPSGLSMPADSLLARLGYNTHNELDGVPFPWTAEMCVKLAGDCYIHGLYIDSQAIADHGLRIAKRPELFYIRGVAELSSGNAAACLQSIKELAAVHPQSLPTQELASISGPVVVRFLIAYRAVREQPDLGVAQVFNSNLHR